jgi:3-oxoacyl-[acyl-carrier protein] reductase
MTNETNKIAIVTGASRGIGAAVAERLAGDGFTVVINYSGDTKSAEALARKIEGNGGRALTAKAEIPTRCGACSTPRKPRSAGSMFSSTTPAS